MVWIHNPDFIWFGLGLKFNNVVFDRLVNHCLFPGLGMIIVYIC